MKSATNIIMEEKSPNVVLIGERGNPDVEAIARAIPAAGASYADSIENCPPDSIVVIHRGVLGEEEAIALERIRGRDRTLGKVVLSVGPETRSRLLERVSPWVDEIFFAATVPESVARICRTRDVRDVERDRARRASVRVSVENGASDIQTLLTESLETLGFQACAASNRSRRAAVDVQVWVAATLEATWVEMIAEKAREGPLVVLLPFADRAGAAIAKSRGASACLDWPCDLEDLAAAIDRAGKA